MADKLHLRYNDQQAEQKLSKRSIDGIHGHCGGIDGVHGLQLENGKSVKKLASFAMIMGIIKSGKVRYAGVWRKSSR